MTRRDDREYREYLREEQRRQPGCPAREVVLDQRGQAASQPTARFRSPVACRSPAPEKLPRPASVIPRVTVVEPPQTAERRVTEHRENVPLPAVAMVYHAVGAGAACIAFDLAQRADQIAPLQHALH